jgi:ankyrin repeat protein
MIDQELARLLSISSSLDKPKVERASKADTKKNRLALIDACNQRQIEEVRQLVSIGAPVNILNERGNYSNQRTPLAICASNGWAEGVQELLEAGADEKLIPNFICDTDGSIFTDKNLPMTCLDVAAQASNPTIFTLLFESHPEALRLRALAHVRHPGTFLAADSLGYAKHISEARQQEILRGCIPGLDPAAGASDEGALKRQAFDAIAAMLGAKGKPVLANTIWLDALSHDRPGIIQGLATRGIMPSADSTIEFIPAKLTNTYWSAPLWIKKEPAPTSWDKNNTRKEFNALAHKPTRMGIASVAAICRRPHGDMNNVHALVAIEPLRRELLDNPIALHFICQCSDLKLFRRLAELGADMASMRDSHGCNPLHNAAKRTDNKTIMEALARLCTDWISQRDDEGKIPVDFEKSDRKASLSQLFDQIGMREGMKGKLGKRHDPAKTRRL